MSASFPREKLIDEERIVQIISSTCIPEQLKDPDNSFLQFLHLNFPSIVDLFLRNNVNFPRLFYTNAELIFYSHCENIKIMMSTNEELLSILFSFLSYENKNSTSIIRGRFYKILEQLLLLSDIDYLAHISQFKTKTVIVDEIEQKKNIGGILFLSLLADNIQYLSIMNFLINIINSHTYSVITFFEQNYFTQILLNKIATINNDTSLATLYSQIPFFDENDIVTTEIDQTGHILDIKHVITQNIFRILLILTRTMSRTSPLVLPLLKPERILTLFDICTQDDKFHMSAIIELIENLHKQNHESSREAIAAINKKLPQICQLIVHSDVIPDASKLDIKEHIAEFGLNKAMKDVDVGLIKLFTSIVNDIYGFGGSSEEEPLDFKMKKNFVASDSLELFHIPKESPEKEKSETVLLPFDTPESQQQDASNEKPLGLNEFNRKRFTFDEANQVNPIDEAKNEDTANQAQQPDNKIEEESNPFDTLLKNTTNSPFQVYPLPTPNLGCRKTPPCKQPQVRPNSISPSNRVRSAMNSTPPAHKSSFSFNDSLDHPQFLDISPISKDATTGENLSLMEIAEQAPTNPHYDSIFNRTNQRYLDDLPSIPLTFSDDDHHRSSFSDSPRDQEFIPGINLDSSPHEIFPLLQSSPAFFHQNNDGLSHNEFFANSSISSNTSCELDSFVEDEAESKNSKRLMPSKSPSTPMLSRPPLNNRLSPLNLSELTPLDLAKSPIPDKNPFESQKSRLSLDVPAMSFRFRYDDYNLNTSKSARVTRPALLSEKCFTIHEDPTEGEEDVHQVQEEEEEEFFEEEEFLQEEETNNNIHTEEENINDTNLPTKKKDRTDSTGSLGSLINQRRPEIIINTTCFLLHQIFDNSLNSNLHHSIIELIETLNKFTSLLPTIFYRSKILNRIIDESQNTRNDGCVNMPFAGYLTKITEIAQKLKHKWESDKHSTKREGWKELELFFQSESWTNYLANVYHVKSEIMNKNYGGFIPELADMIDESKERILRPDL